MQNVEEFFMADANKTDPSGVSLPAGTSLEGWLIEGPAASLSPTADYFRVSQGDRAGLLKVHRQKGAVRDKALGRLAGFEHPGVHRLMAFGTWEGLAWEVWAPIPGPAVSGPLAEAAWLSLIRAVHLSLQACHSAGILHRNLRTGSVFRSGDSWVLGEFGTLPAVQQAAGYSAPEAYSGVVGPEVDYYSFGLLAWEAATGLPAFSQENPQFLIRDTIGGRAVEDLLVRPETQALPDRTKALLAGLLTTRHDRRWGAAEVGAWLDEAVRETGPAATVGAEAPTVATVGPEAWTQAYLDALVPGSRVNLKPGTYAGGLTLRRAVHLSSADPKEPALIVPADLPLDQKSFGLVLEGPEGGSLNRIVFRGENFTNHLLLSVTGGTWLVQDCEFRGAYEAGITVAGAETAPKVKGGRIYGGNNGVSVSAGAAPVFDQVDIVDHIRNNFLVQDAGSAPTVKNCRLFESKQCGIAVTKGAGGVYEDNEVRSNSLANIMVRDYGTNPVFRNNRVSEGRRGGIYVLENAGGTFEGNDVFANTAANVEIKDAGTEPLFRANKVREGKQGGFSVHGGAGGVYEGNEVFGNALANVAVFQSGTAPEFRRNRIHDGKHSGFSIYGGASGEYEENDIYGNSQANVIVFQTGTMPAFVNNKVHSGRQGGFFIHGGAAGQFEGNEVFDNALANVEVLDPGTNPTFRKNKVHSCLNEGLFVQNGASGRYEGNDFNGNGFSTKGLKDAGPGYPSIRIQGSGTNPVFRENQVTGFAASAFEISKGAGGTYEANTVVNFDQENNFVFEKLWDVKWGTSAKRKGNTGD